MAKVVLTDKAPKANKDEMVIGMPDFLKEIKASHRKASGKQVTSVNHLREMVSLIAERLYPNFDYYPRIPFSNYEGIAYKTDEDLAEILNKILNRHAADLLTKAVDAEVKSRPATTKTIYFTGPDTYLQVFLDNGIAVEDAKKKGKPADETED